jgi:formate/nitrite transporter FocA (FNT family)
MPEVFGFDCYSPKEIAERVENVGVTKANLPLLSQVALGVLAGGFIGSGAMFFTLLVSDTNLSFALSRVLGGAAFSLGLILVVVAGAELFTGNNLLVMATVAGRIPASTFLQNLVVIYLANFVGAVGLAALVALSGHWLRSTGRASQGIFSRSRWAISSAARGWSGWCIGSSTGAAPLRPPTTRRPLENFILPRSRRLSPACGCAPRPTRRPVVARHRI